MQDNVWIGEGVAIIPGVTIGGNSIIATNAVVTKDIPANCVAAAVPAKVKKRIFYYKIIMEKGIKPIAIYLPQFHPIPENDKWWGNGFTEWTNVAKAKPLFKGHEQPKLPADLGFYDLRVSETREQQAAIAREYGIYGFCYYHYWFGDSKQLLERPFNEVLASGKPDFPFMLCWANQTWSGIWFGQTDKILVEQAYPGKEDIEKHFNYLLPAFKDERYIKVDGKPFFIVYDVLDLPNPKEFADFMNKLAIQNGFKGIHLVGGNLRTDKWDPIENGFNAKISNEFNLSLQQFRSDETFLMKLWRKFKKNSVVEINHEALVARMNFDYKKNYYPLLVPNWDNTPRSGNRGIILNKSSPELFEEQIKRSVAGFKNVADEEKFIFLKSWNEWAEGNYLEPDTRWGFAYLAALKRALIND